MSFEKSVINYEKAKSLWNRGVRGESRLFWADVYTYDSEGNVTGTTPVLVRPNTGVYDFMNITPIPAEAICNDDKEWDWKGEYPAYSAEQIANLLPIGNSIYPSDINIPTHAWTCANDVLECYGATLTEAVAEMVDLLLEAEIITIEDVNPKLAVVSQQELDNTIL